MDPRDEMDCDRLRELLTEHVDGLLGAEDAENARVHLARCAPCGALQDEVRRCFAALDTWKDEDLPAGAYDRLVARLPGVRPPVHVAPPAADVPAAASRPRVIRPGAAIPYLAGLATAAVVVALVVPRDAAEPERDPVRAQPPAMGTAVATPVRSEAGPAPTGSGTVSPASLALRPGERALRFDTGGVRRVVVIPEGLDPAHLAFPGEAFGLPGRPEPTPAAESRRPEVLYR